MELFLYGKSYSLFHRYWWFSPLHRRCSIDYQYSCQYSYEYLSTGPRVRVQVWVLSRWNSRVRVHYKYQKFSTRVRVPSTSTPTLLTGFPIWPDHCRLAVDMKPIVVKECNVWLAPMFIHYRQKIWNILYIIHCLHFCGMCRVFL